RTCAGRSLLLFGSNEEIAARMATLGQKVVQPPVAGSLGASFLTQGPATVQAHSFATEMDNDLDFDLNVKNEITVTEGDMFIGNKPLPSLPLKLSPSQAARVAEILDFLHRGLSQATEHVRANEEGTQITINYSDWQKALAVQMLLARYLRAIAEPDTLDS